MQCRPQGTANAPCLYSSLVFFQIALLNVLTGIFVENAMKLAQPDPYTQALETRKKEFIEAAELRSFCSGLSQSGSITLQDFEREMAEGDLRAHLHVLGLEIKDPKKFFDILQATNDKPALDIDTFVHGCMKLKGYATAVDLQSLMCETRKAAQDVSRMAKKVLDTKENLEHCISSMNADQFKLTNFKPMQNMASFDSLDSFGGAGVGAESL